MVTSGGTGKGDAFFTAASAERSNSGLPLERTMRASSTSPNGSSRTSSSASSWSGRPAGRSQLRSTRSLISAM